MTRFLRGIAVAISMLLSTTLLVGAAHAEQSGDQSGVNARVDPLGIDVTIRADGQVRVRSGACFDVPFTVEHNLGYLDRFTAEVEVWRGRQYVDQSYDYQYETDGPLRGSFHHCIWSLDDLGTFRLGPTVGEYNLYDTSYDSWYSDVDGEYSDASSATIKILQDSRITKMKVVKKGKKRMATARAAYFDAGASRYRDVPRKTKVKLQFKQPNGVWKTAATGRVAAKGKITVSTKAKKARQYRLVLGETPRSWGATSATVRR